MRTTGYYHELEAKSREELRAEKWERLQNILQLAAAKSREFKDRLSRSGISVQDIASEKDFQAIPPLPKKDLITLQERDLNQLLTTELGNLAHIYMSPGPIFDPEGTDDDYWGWAEAFYAVGFRPKDIVQMTFSYHMTPAGLMLEQPLRKLGCAVIPAGPGNTEAQITLLTKLKATGFVGMASYLKTIGEKAKAAGLDLKKDFNLQVAFVAAEILTPSMRKELEEEFGLILRQGYGTADVGCIAYECPQAQGMHISTRCWVEICHPGTGEPVPEGEIGEVVVTPFSTTYPLIRLATGDLAAIDYSQCPCGRTAPRIKGIFGRTDSTAKVKGQFVYQHQVSQVMAEFPVIINWRLTLTNPQGKDTLTLYVQAREGLDEKKLIAAFKEKIKLLPALEIIPADQKLENGGKIVDERVWEK
ncbi:AMP-binding protein [Desulfohalobiaceae bacterium Ax17]|uniref:phenylacetate--CoA ligase family protein n=1 Tax=Desulfovulcanus ferrireducens TaxID=2831190 RepID=UPI00207BB856|nr:AMP-binding protein [Desulfovulcanus ferrireducens]MBT8763195.1 AMP-binding protein [Desulfovulcanus ferrireducens]